MLFGGGDSHLLGAALVLGALFGAAFGCVIAPRRAWGWLVLVLSILWLHVNNGVLEGSTLIVLDASHGVTQADLVSVVGIALAVATLWRCGAGDPRRPWHVAGAAALAVVGVALALAGSK